MKKWTKVLSAFVVAAVMSVGVGTSVGCGKKNNDNGTEHEHTWANTWSKDASGHWHAATCEGHENIKDEVKPHVYDDDQDTTCNTCGYERTVTPPEHSHNIGTTWTTNETHHWHDADCGNEEHDTDKGAHVDSNNDGKCDTCEYTMSTTPEHSHTVGTTWSSDDTYHWHDADCGIEEHDEDKAAHVDADKNGKCDVCDHDVEVVVVAGKTYEELVASSDKIYSEDFSTTTSLEEFSDWGTAGLYIKHSGSLTGRYSIAGGKLTVGDGEQYEGTTCWFRFYYKKWRSV